MQLIQVIKVNFLAALVFAPMVSSAQFSLPEAEVQRFSQLSQAMPFMAYLRCEEASPERAGDRDYLLSSLAFLMQSIAAASPAEFKGQKSDELGVIPLAVWPGILAEVQVVAAQGIFGAIQYYRKADKEPLLKALAGAGWVLKRLPPDPASSSAMKLVQVYQASQPVEKPTRTLTLMDARISESGRGVTDFDALTVMCGYGERRR